MRFHFGSSLAAAVVVLAGACRPESFEIDLGMVPVSTLQCPNVPSGSQQHVFPDTLVDMLEANGYCHYFIPEYHDEQRLSDGGTDYGHLAYVFAAPRVQTIADHGAFDDAWVNVAIIDVARNRPPFGNTLAATYTALNLTLQQNCLYIRHRHTAGSAQWEAVIGPPRTTASNVRLCNGGVGRRIPVAREEPSPNPAHYIGAARFVEGASQRRPMIGVRCGNGFCVAGARSTNDIPTHAHASLTLPPNPQWHIKPWFDDQVVGVVGPGGFGIHPGLRASVVPDTALASRTVTQFRSAWIPVATVFIPGNLRLPLPPKYGFHIRPEGDTTGFGFTAGLNRIEMRAITIGGVEHWKARILNSTFPNGFIRVVKRADHLSWVQATGIPVPATARFRWLDNDETIWVACDAGCCRVEAY